MFRRIAFTIDQYKAIIAAVAGLLVAFFGPRAGVDTVSLIAAIAVIVSYIIGVKIEAGLRNVVPQ